LTIETRKVHVSSQVRR